MRGLCVPALLIAISVAMPSCVDADNDTAVAMSMLHERVDCTGPRGGCTYNTTRTCIGRDTNRVVVCRGGVVRSVCVVQHVEAP